MIADIAVQIWSYCLPFSDTIDLKGGLNSSEITSTLKLLVMSNGRRPSRKFCSVIGIILTNEK